MKAITFNGDCLEILKKIESSSVHSIVTDPPAGIGFLGHEWDKDKGGRDDWIKWMESVMRECHRIIKPGGHAVVWALPRTSHWTATAVENSGFELRDIITHLFNSGVPPAGDIGKNVDRALGVEPKVVGFRRNPSSKYYNGSKQTGPIPVLAPQTELGKRWSGWMPRLKPASEHWIVARKPLGASSIVKNVLLHQTGALNIESCRVEEPRSLSQIDFGHKARFPANVVLSHNRRCSDNSCHHDCAIKEIAHQSDLNVPEYFNTFYYSPKAPKQERLEGVDDESAKQTSNS